MTPPSKSIIARKIDSLQSAKRNARTHSRRQIDQIAQSLETFGFVNPVLIDAEGRIVAGHGRVAAARRLGLSEVPTLSVTHLSPEQLRAYAIADNRLAELAGWDEAVLKLELGELADLVLDFDLEVTGFDTAKIDLLLRSEVAESEAADESMANALLYAMQRGCVRTGTTGLGEA